MAQNIVETALGAAVSVAALGFGFYVSSSTKGQDSGESYPLYAKFGSVDGITTGTDVRMSGVKIGTVKRVSLDEKTFQATTELAIDDRIKLPIDSSAKIESDGLLGGAHITLTPGGEDDVLPKGSQITYTQGAVNVIELFSKAVHGGVSDGK